MSLFERAMSGIGASPADGTLISMGTLRGMRVRRATPEDEPFLTEMLRLAAGWR